MSPRAILVLLVTGVLVVPSSVGFINPSDPWERTAKLQDSNAEPGDAFGGTLVGDGDTMVVGHPLEDHKGDMPSGADVGAVTVYERDGGGWVPQETFYGPAPLGRFGSAIALDGDTFVTNAPGQKSSDGCLHSTGELYVYTRVSGVWQRNTVLEAPGVDSHEDCLGGALSATHSLAIDGDLLAAGASRQEGKVFVYARGADGWALDGEVSRTEDMFGSKAYGSVDISESAKRLSVGAMPAPTEGVDDWVAVDVYDRTSEGWVRTATLNSAHRVAGYRVELSQDGSTIMTTGSPWSENPYVPVHVWTETSHGWSQVTKLWPWDVNDFNPLISDIDLNAAGDTLAVGTWLDDITPGLAPELRSEVPIGVATIRLGAVPGEIASPFGNGATYVFRTNDGGGWEQAAKIMPRDEVGMNLFGWDVSFDDGRMAVGAPMDYGAMTNPGYYDGEATGAVYIFEETVLGPSSTVLG